MRAVKISPVEPRLRVGSTTSPVAAAVVPGVFSVDAISGSGTSAGSEPRRRRSAPGDTAVPAAVGTDFTKGMNRSLVSSSSLELSLVLRGGTQLPLRVLHAVDVAQVLEPSSDSDDGGTGSKKPML